MRYDDGALAIADDADKISLPVAKAIFEEVQDGGVVTPTEWRTLSYIADGGKDGAQYALTAPARKYLLDLVRAEDGGGEEEEDRDGNLATENDIETDEEEDLPATVRKVRGSGGNDADAAAGARNKRVSFGAARDDVGVGPPIANVNARKTRRHSWRRRHPLTEDRRTRRVRVDARQRRRRRSPRPRHRRADDDDGEAPHLADAGGGSNRRDPAARATRHRAHVAPASDPRRGGRPAERGCEGGDRSGAGRASRGDDDDDSGSESESDDGGHRFIPNSVGGRMRGRVNSGGFTVFNVTMPQLTDRVPYGTAAIYVAAAYFAALIAKASLGFCGVKWGGLLWGTGARLATGTCCPTTAWTGRCWTRSGRNSRRRWPSWRSRSPRRRGDVVIL